ncbi:unnamed protein product [Mytilus edulis]|uniref:Reverse transcriptase domain-containing protein n=1 Tax=Mytilus edulis TaxID=6550 RepID=A0A8S3RXX0_MYTED|nr:unnamed protein product [Mytilus edulis]
MDNLNDPIHYEQVDKSDFEELIKILNEKINNLYRKSYIDDTTLKYLSIPKNTRLGRLYFLPKIHKVNDQDRNQLKVNKEWLDNINITGRPIVSLCNSPLEKVGTFLDYFINPVVKQQWTYTKDTTDFINKLEKIKLPQEIIMCSFDISSMYTNMRHEEIIEAVDRAWPKLNKCVYEIQLPPKTEFLELLKIVLQNNIFEFHGNIFRQRVGVPMGLSAAPCLTDLRMFEIISDILNRFQYSEDILMISIYRDDGFIIFNKSERHFMEFIKIANSIHPLIKFTHTISNTEIQFLDVTIYKGKRFLEDNILDVKLYRKPTGNNKNNKIV